MIDIRYLAGLIDGEGCITIFRHKGKGCRTDHWSYRPLVQIGMTHKPTLHAIHLQFGGQFKQKRGQDITRRSYAVWTLRGGNCIDLLREIAPYLITKKEEARLLITFWDDKDVRLPGGTMKRIKGTAREALKAKREWYRLKLQSLKRVEFSLSWNAGEVGEQREPPIPSQADAKASGVCNEHGPASKEKMCSDLHGNMQNAAETPASLRLVAKA